MSKMIISTVGLGNSGATVTTVCIQNRTLKVRFNSASSFRDINILLYDPKVVKTKFRNIPHAYIKDRVAEDIKRLHDMKDEPLVATAVITRHPNLWKWSRIVFKNWDTAIEYTAAKYPESKIDLEEIKNSYHAKRKEVIEEIIRLIRSGKLTSTTPREWILRNIRQTYDRACIYYGGWNEAFNTAQAEFSKRRHAILYSPPKIPKNPNFLP